MAALFGGLLILTGCFLIWGGITGKLPAMLGSIFGGGPS